MRYLTPCLLLIITFAACTDQEGEAVEPTAVENPTFCECGDVILNEEENRSHYYEVEEWFTGTCYRTSGSGDTISKRDYVDGHIHGEVLEWYDNGQQKSIKEFKNNRQDGVFRQWNEDGSLEYAARYAKGQFVEKLPE